MVEQLKLARQIVLLCIVTAASAGARAVVTGAAATTAAAAAFLVAGIALEIASRRRFEARLPRELVRWARRERPRIDAVEPSVAPARREPIERTDVERSDITLTDADFERLAHLVDAFGPELLDAIDGLEAELGRARVVPSREVPPDVVTMNSRVRYVDESDGAVRELTIVYPKAADAAEARVSVLAPVGAALLGLRVGQSIEWPLPDGRRKRYRVVDVPFQPEAAGRFDL